MIKLLNPVKTRFLISSQPIPPAPTTSTLHFLTASERFLCWRQTAILKQLAGKNEKGGKNKKRRQFTFKTNLYKISFYIFPIILKSICHIKHSVVSDETE